MNALLGRSAPLGFSKREWKYLCTLRSEARQRKRNRLLIECDGRLRYLDQVLSGFAAEPPIPSVASRRVDA